MRAIMWMTLALVGCAGEGAPEFQGGGVGYHETNTGTDDTGGGTDDSGSADGAPELTSISAAFADYPNIGDVVEVIAAYTDAEGDLDGGVAMVAIASPTVGASEDFELDIGDELARLDVDPDTEETVVIVAIQVPSTDYDYEIALSVVDAAGNASNELEATVP